MYIRPLTCTCIQGTEEARKVKTCIQGTEEARKVKTIAYSSKKNSTDANGCIAEEKPIK